MGTGHSTSLWFDNWHPWGPLYKLLDGRSTSILGRAIWAKVSYVVLNGEWHWPRPRNNLIQRIQNAIPPTLLPQADKEDEVVWTVSPTGQYVTKHTWEAVRHHGVKVQWAPLVWFSKNVPKWAFILWLACLNRLSTKDRLRKWGMDVDPKCTLCSISDETLQHLFFYCSYSRVIWEQVLSRFSMHKGVGSGMQSSVGLLGIAGEKALKPYNIRLRTCSWRHIDNTLENQRLLDLWNLPNRIVIGFSCIASDHCGFIPVVDLVGWF
ncbi:uncharacterized protein LOC131332062 [Rhododendron vialii]|uniref:uncharacterized protein LOC131332062 n=1 Tax=Rhododendron vialii TaxID=182163 RepID=UPI00265FBB49|nr:uncharacterized protein LOC131332062 [Rhododendron vialii]